MFRQKWSPVNHAYFGGASHNGCELSHASGSSRTALISFSPLSQRKRQFSLLTSLHSLLVLLGGRPQAASLVRGLRPRNAPSPTTCLVDRVPEFATGAQSTEFIRTRSLQSHQIPVGVGLVPAVAQPPICGPHDKSQLGAALRLSRSRQTLSATPGMNSPPGCSHLKSGMYPNLPYLPPEMSRVPHLSYRIASAYNQRFRSPPNAHSM